MGRGLSPLQRGILGLAYAVNTHTQGGNPAVKTGGPVNGYRGPTVNYTGPKDLKTSLAVYAVKRIEPSTAVNNGFFHGTPKCKSAKASIARAITRLTERNLLIYAPEGSDLCMWGYLLTAEGFKIAKDIECAPPGLAEAIELFGIRAGSAFLSFQAHKKKTNPGYTYRYSRWSYEAYSEGRSEIITRLCDALTVIEVAPCDRVNHYMEG